MNKILNDERSDQLTLAAHQTISTLQSIIEEKNKQIKKKEDIIKRIRDENFDGRERDKKRN